MSKKVVIDAGHGGKDSGTVHNGIIEKDYTLKISKYIKERLDELGIPAELTRTTDELLDQTTRPKRAQSFFGNGTDVIVLSNHLNAGASDGAEIIYSLRNDDTLSKKIAKELEEAGQNVRKYYQRRLPSNPSKDYYYLLRETPNNETLIVEYGFADSPKDDVNQIKNDWKSLAEAVVKAIASYAGTSYSNKTNTNENFYTVKKGDSLYAIAKKFNISVDSLKNANNKNNNLIKVGEKLMIPNKNIYTVKKGDSLYAIAKKYNTSINDLKTKNNLKSDVLQIGQKLII